MTATRVWDRLGVTSLQALQAPYLIDSDALARAVAVSDIARRAMDGMSTAGLEGLALWPEELRHLFAIPGCGRDLRSPDGLTGATVAVSPSELTNSLIRLMNGSAWNGQDRQFAADSCALQAAEAGMTGNSVPRDDAVGVVNLVLFPKYQLLTMNKSAFDHLTVNQREALTQAAEATAADALTRQPDEARLAAAWCTHACLLAADAADLQAYAAAAEPIYRDLEGDPLTRDLIARIRELEGLDDGDAPRIPVRTPQGKAPHVQPG